MSSTLSYEQACAEHRWDGARALQHRRRRLRPAPARQAGDDPRGLRRATCAGWTGASSRTPPTALPTCWWPTACSAATAWRCCCRRRPRRRRRSSAPGRWGRSCCRCRCSTATRASATALTDSQPKVLVTNQANADRMERSLVEHVLILDDALLSTGSDTFETVDTAADDPAQLYYSSGTTGLAKGILHAHRYVLAHEEFVYCHDVQDGELFHGMGEWAWAAGIAPLLGPVALRRGPMRLPARGRASIPPSSWTSSRATRSPTCSGRRRRSAR